MLEVVGARASQFGGESGCPGMTDLLGVESKSQSIGCRRVQDLSGLIEREHSDITEDIAPTCAVVVSEPSRFDDFGDVVGAVSSMRDDVRTEVRRLHLPWQRLREVADYVEAAEFVVNGEAVSGLDLDRGRSVRDHPTAAIDREFQKIVVGSSASVANRRLDAAAVIGLSGKACDELLATATCPDQMRVGVDESGEDDTLFGVNLVDGGELSRQV